MALLKAGATYTRTFLAVYKTDHITGATGLTVIVRLSKAGAAFAAAAGTVSGVSNGWYSIALTAADTGTLGDLSYNCTGTNIDPTDFVDQVVNFDFNVPVVTAGTTVGTVSLTGGTYAVNLSGSVNNVIQPTTTTITGGTISGVTGTVGSVIAGVTVTTNNDKTGYSLAGGTQTFNIVGTQSGPFVAPVNLASGVNVTQWANGTAPSPVITGEPIVTLAGGTYSVNLGGSVNSVVQPTTTVITGGTISGVSGTVGSVIAPVNIANGVNVTQWAGATANSLISGRVDSNAQVVGDKTGYSIASGTQTFNIAGTQSGPFVGTVTLASGTHAGAIIPTVVSVNSVSGAVGSVTAGVTVTTNNDKTNYSLASGTQAGVIIPTVVSVNSVSGSVGSVTGAVGSVTGNLGGSVNSVVNSIVTGTNNDKTGYSLSSSQTFNVTGNITGNVSGSVGSVTGSVGSVLGSVVTGTNADKTGYSLSSGQLFVKKNTGLNNFMFLMLDSSDHVTPKTGLTITSQVSIDGAAFGNTANSASEIGSGIYKINLATTDTNGTTLMFKFSSAGADTRYIEIVTQA